MKKINLIFVMILIAFLAVSCKVNSYTYSARSTNVGMAGIEATPTLVDVNVDFNQRVTFDDNDYVKYKLSKNLKETEKLALEAAKYQCITKNSIHVIVDPIYKIELKGIKKAKVHLSGFAGYYTNQRTRYEDINNLKSVNLDEVKKYLYLMKPELMLPQYNNDAPINISFPINE